MYIAISVKQTRKPVRIIMYHAHTYIIHAHIHTYTHMYTCTRTYKYSYIYIILNVYPISMNVYKYCTFYYCKWRLKFVKCVLTGKYNIFQHTQTLDQKTYQRYR